MEAWKRILFLGCPIINGTYDLVDNGLFLNDLSIHDHSRDMVITNTQALVSWNIFLGTILFLHILNFVWLQMEEVMTKKYNEMASSLVVDMDNRQEVLQEENDRKFRSW